MTPSGGRPDPRGLSGGRARCRGDAGVSVPELLITVLVVALCMAAVMSWVVSTESATAGGVDQAMADADIGAFVEIFGRDARSAIPVSDASGAPILTSLDADTLQIHHDRDADGVPSRIVWDRPAPGEPLVRLEYAGVTGSGPDWSFEADEVARSEYFTAVVSDGVFTAVDDAGGSITTCDASTDPHGCAADGVRIALTYRGARATEFDLVADFTFRNEPG